MVFDLLFDLYLSRFHLLFANLAFESILLSHHLLYFVQLDPLRDLVEPRPSDLCHFLARLASLTLFQSTLLME